MRIVERHRAHSRHIAVMLALLVSVLAVPAAPAAPAAPVAPAVPAGPAAPAAPTARAAGLPPGGINLRASFTGARAWSGAPGVRSQIVSPGARAAVLAQGTGLTPAEVTTENVCGEPAAGRARCAAQILVLRGTHTRVHPRAPRSRTFTQVFPRVRRAAAPATSGSPAAAGLTAHSPAWLQQAYDLSYLSQTGGVGDTVAIVDAYHDPTVEADLAQYRTNYGLSPCTTANGCFRLVNENGQSSPMPPNNKSWEQEISLDLDAVSAICPNCHILLVEAATNAWGDLATAVQTAVTMGAQQVSNSYSGYWWGTWPYTYTFPGVSVVAATGDHGFLNQGDTDSSAHGYNNYPAALPGVIAAGGTSLAAASGGQSPRGYSESAWALTASGWGSDSGCETALPKPAYQTDSGCTGRAYSDVSADADPSTGLNVYDSGNGGWLLMGGTSLSAPVIAAYEAVTGITASDPTPQWAYTDSTQLNDPVGGSVGTCPPSLAYLCAAGVGYDGPTGTGSISGAVAQGAPGIGGPTFSSGYLKAATPTSLTLMGGVYPNGIDTTYYWQYGQTNAYGQQTAPVDIGAGKAPVTVTDTAAGLITGTTYHARLVATNSTGTSYGYDFTAQTLLNGQLPPTNTTAPAITGTAREGQSLIASGGTWSPSPATYGYKWQRSADGSMWSDITGAGSQAYVLTAADVGDQIRVIVTATNSYGSGTATASSVGPVGSGVPVNSALPVIAGTVQQGQALTTSTGTWSPAGSVYTYQWQRSTDNGSSWTSIANAVSPTLIPGSVDIAALLRVTVTATNPYGTASVASGPVGPASSGAPKNVQAPVINGTPRQGQVLTVSSDWNPAGTTYTYTWERSADGHSWATIASATGSSYTPTAADEGLSLRVTVTAANVYGAAANTSATAGPIAANPPVNTASPTISGTTQRTFTLHAAQGSWNGANNTYSYQWQRSIDGSHWSAISGASGPVYTLTIADVGDVIRVLVSASNIDGIATQTSSPTLMISPDPPASLSPPTITGTAQRTSTLTASLGTWTGPDNIYSYQWQRDAGDGYVNIASQTAWTYTLTAADEGATVRVVVTASNPDATISEASQPTVTVVGAGPVNQTPPVVSGAAQRASTLTASPGVWSGLGNNYAYQWQRSPDGTIWSDITGQTFSSYVVGTADEGNAVRVLVTATNGDGVAAVASAPTATIPSAAPANTAAPTVAGAAVRATMLTSGPGTWTGIGNAYTYQWQRSSDGSTWTNIAGETAWIYTLTTADEGAHVRVLVTATNPDGTLTVPSAPTATVQASAPSNTTAPTIAGSAQRGMTLTGTQGVWTGIGNTYAYQWQRSSASGWSDIGGATSPVYTLAVADEGHTVRLQVTATNTDAAVSAGSAASWTVQASPPLNTIAPIIAGLAQRTTTLTSTTGTWTGNGNAYSDQWQRSTDGATWTDIAGATNSTYKLTVTDEGSQVRLLVTATNPDGSVSAASTASASVTGGAPVNTAVPAMAGSAQRGSLLTATPGAWTGLENTYAFQWQRSNDGTTWTNISGETSSSHLIGVADEGDSLRVAVTATNADGTVTAVGGATAVIPSSPPSNTTAPTVTGTAQRTFTLTATQGTWAGIGNTYTFQWQHDTGSGYVDIVGQTGTTYALGVPDEGTTVRVLITATNADGTVTKASAPTATVLAAAPHNSVAPTLTGTPQRGLMLTGTLGTWDGIGNAYAYQWQRSADGTTWTTITGATNPTYTLAVADEGAQVRVQVTATNADGSAIASSPATAAVTGGTPVNLTPPTFAGAPQRATKLAVTSNGNWAGIGNTLTRQWQRSADGGQTWTNIVGQTDGTYTLTLADEGATVRLLVTATNADGATGAASAPSATVTPAPALNTTPPVVTGTPQRSATLTASLGTWSGPDNAYGFQWQRSTDHGASWSKITGATTSAYRVLAGDEAAIIRAQVTASNPDGTVTAFSQATSAIQAAPPVNLTPPAVTGIPQRTMTLTATQGTWSGADNTYIYQWQRSTDQGATWTPIVGANAVSYTLQTADENANIRVFITAGNPDGGAGSPSPATPAVQPAPPVSTVAPTVAGAARLAGTLTAAPGTWAPAGASFAYQWQRSTGTSTWTDISGATNLTYTLGGADVGHTVRVLVTASNLDGNASAPSAATSTVLEPPQNLTAPAVPTGTLMDTYRLTADPGTWDTPGATFTYAWLRCPADATSVTEACVQVGSGLTYTLGAADVGEPMAVSVTAASPGGTAPALASQLTSLVTGRPLTNLRPPNITGNPQIPGTLNANPGTWSVPLSGIVYTWQRCDAAGGACVQAGTGVQYALGEADRGHTIVLTALATSPGRSVSASSEPLAVQDQALPQASALPNISGAAVRTVTLTTTAGEWTNSPSTIAYQWLRCNADRTGCQTIPGATTASYTLALADEGHAVTVQVTATNTSGSGTATARATGAVSAAPPSVIHPPAVTGAAYQQDVALSVVANSAVWQETPDTTYTATWKRCDADGTNCQTIGGANATQYTPSRSDVGHALVLAITATNPDGSATATSTPTPAIVPAPPRWRALPLISPDPGRVGDVLSVTPGVWSGTPVNADDVQMMRCTNTCSAVGPVDATSYTITSGDLGAILRVREYASNTGGYTVIWSARFVGPVSSAASGSAVVADNADARVRNTQGIVLALASLQTNVSANVASVRSVVRHIGRTLVLRRGPRAGGRLRAWACPVATLRGGAPAPCTRKVSVGARTSLALPASMTGRMRVIVVRQRH